jgi:hypothetical protein
MSCPNDLRENGRKSIWKKFLAFFALCGGYALALGPQIAHVISKSLEQASHIAQIIATAVLLWHTQLTPTPNSPPSQPPSMSAASESASVSKHPKNPIANKSLPHHKQAVCVVVVNQQNAKNDLNQQYVNGNSSGLNENLDHKVVDPASHIECNADGKYTPPYETVSENKLSFKPQSAFILISHPARYPCN